MELFFQRGKLATLQQSYLILHEGHQSTSHTHLPKERFQNRPECQNLDSTLLVQLRGERRKSRRLKRRKSRLRQIQIPAGDVRGGQGAKRKKRSRSAKGLQLMLPHRKLLLPTVKAAKLALCLQPAAQRPGWHRGEEQPDWCCPLCVRLCVCVCPTLLVSSFVTFKEAF